MMNLPTITYDIPDSVPVFNYFDRDYQGEGRYQFLAKLRENRIPLAVDQFMRVNLLRYEDVRAAFVDNNRYLSGEASVAEAIGGGEGPLVDWQRNTLINMNPPRHTRLRNSLRHFNARLARRLHPMIREQCHRLIDAFPVKGEIDFSREFAFKLPVRVIMALLNMPGEDEGVIGEWSPKTLPVGPDAIEASNCANQQFRTYIERLIDDRRGRPLDGDVVSELIELQNGGDLTQDELWATIQTLILAGHETTSGALATGLYTLLERPERWERVRSARDGLANTAEEILRWDAPVESMPRVLAEDTLIHGVHLRAGTFLNLNIASANHDPRIFESPEEFDMFRTNAKKQLSFGVGIHRCVGAPLAQAEILIALDVLAERLTTIEVVEEPTYAPGFFRHFNELRLVVHQQSAA